MLSTLYILTLWGVREEDNERDTVTVYSTYLMPLPKNLNVSGNY